MRHFQTQKWVDDKQNFRSQGVPGATQVVAVG